MGVLVIVSWNMLEDASFLLHSQDFELLDCFLVAGWDTNPCHARWRQASLIPALGAQQKKTPSNFKIRRRYLCLIYSYLISSLTSKNHGSPAFG